MAIQNYHAELLNAISDAKKGLSSSITLNVNVVSGDPKVLDNALSQWSRFITHTYSKSKGCKGTLDFKFERNLPGKKDIDLSAVKSTHTLSDVILLISEQLGLGRNYGFAGKDFIFYTSANVDSEGYLIQAKDFQEVKFITFLKLLRFLMMSVSKLMIIGGFLNGFLKLMQMLKTSPNQFWRKT